MLKVHQSLIKPGEAAKYDSLTIKEHTQWIMAGIHRDILVAILQDNPLSIITEPTTKQLVNSMSASNKRPVVYLVSIMNSKGQSLSARTLRSCIRSMRLYIQKDLNATEAKTIHEMDDSASRGTYKIRWTAEDLLFEFRRYYLQKKASTPVLPQRAAHVVTFTDALERRLARSPADFNQDDPVDFHSNYVGMSCELAVRHREYKGQQSCLPDDHMLECS